MSIEWVIKKPRWIVLRPHTKGKVERLEAYDPADNEFLSPERCFLCGCDLRRSKTTDEHVFPKWLLNRYQLWDGKLGLLNGTEIPYRKIKIPSCATCNGVYLSSLERQIETAVDGGHNAFRKLSRGAIFQWLTKIFFQILYLEMRLLADVRNPTAGTIVKRELLEEFRLEHVLLNSTRMPVKVSRPEPWSIFVVRTQKLKRNSDNFDFVDNLVGQGIAIRMSDIGVVALLNDAHAQAATFSDTFTNMSRRLTLHPIQFRELAAKAFYKRYTMNRAPKFTTWWSGDRKRVQVVTHHIAGLSSKPIFDPWSQEEYAGLLHKMVGGWCGLTMEQMFEPPDKVMTFLRRGRRYTHIPIDALQPIGATTPE